MRMDLLVGITRSKSLDYILQRPGLTEEAATVHRQPFYQNMASKTWGGAGVGVGTTPPTLVGVSEDWTKGTTRQWARTTLSGMARKEVICGL